ncbi:PF20097 family protein [Ruminococcus albus]|uniref:DUF6487 domain-containing protein n=1 Tax=Ruminococcus albus TaxID=1264 RepID=A0A1I1HMK4_RUMAL|nr:PF20097 family protein [Ruminococcus albus]SFC25164.1 hypothetical protein SAMN02910406_01414 [Ruminococcus albus]
MADKEYIEKRSFTICPRCGGKLISGRISVPTDKKYANFGPTKLLLRETAEIRWYSKKTIMSHRNKKFLSRLIPARADKYCYLDAGDKYPAPAKYCKNCNKIFAEFDVL